MPGLRSNAQLNQGRKCPRGFRLRFLSWGLPTCLRRSGWLSCGELVYTLERHSSRILRLGSCTVLSSARHPSSSFQITCVELRSQDFQYHQRLRNADRVADSSDESTSAFSFTRLANYKHLRLSCFPIHHPCNAFFPDHKFALPSKYCWC